ncbi:copper-binding transcription factor [Coemansia spiralis]|nr:copper-binding transcription factor [Coemansia spiralis]
MIIISGQKFACDQCVRGHRASNCNHTDRALNPIKRKGRPPSQCDSCRTLRLTRKAHVKCECQNKSGATARRAAAAARAAADMVGEPVAVAMPDSPTKLRRIESADMSKAKGSSIESLLNPCNCSSEQFCTCCKPRFTEFLSRSYPAQVVEQEAQTLGESLKRPRPMAPGHSDGARRPPHCPSGPSAPCCAPAARPPPNGLRSLGSLPSQLPSQQHLYYNGRPPLSQPLPRLQQTSMARSLPMPVQRPATFAHSSRPPPPPGLPSQALERPSCGCGCQCSKKLDMLVRAIESRLGQEGLVELTARAQLGPLSSPVRPPPASARPFPQMAHAPVRPASYGPPMSTQGTASAPQSARYMSLQPPRPLTYAVSRSRSNSTGSSTSSVGSSVNFTHVPATQSPARYTDAPQLPSHPRPFADGVVPPVASSAARASSTGPCRSPQPSLPQQELPVKSCCSTKPANDQAAAAKPSCCSGTGSKTCACCKRAGWHPGDPSKPEVDADGALACACGCHKPLAECTNCIKDECEELLFNPSV